MTSPDNDFKRSAIVACLHNDIFLIFSKPRFSMFNREIILEFLIFVDSLSDIIFFYNN